MGCLANEMARDPTSLQFGGEHLTFVNRRDIADDIRSLVDHHSVPTDIEVV